MDRYPESIDAVASHLSQEWAHVLHDPIASCWYPEEALQQLLRGLWHEIANGEAVAYEALVEDASQRGINRFLSAVLGLTTPRFIVGRIPTMWSLLRRGSSNVSVQRASSGSIVEYRKFPFFGDLNYRLLARGSIRVLVRQTGARDPQVELGHWNDDELDVHITHD